MPWIKKLKADNHTCSTPLVYWPLLEIQRYAPGAQWVCGRCKKTHTVSWQDQFVGYRFKED